MDPQVAVALVTVGGVLGTALGAYLVERRRGDSDVDRAELLALDQRARDLLDRYDRDRKAAELELRATRDEVRSLAAELAAARADAISIRSEASLDRIKLERMTRRVEELAAGELADKAEISRLRDALAETVAERDALRAEIQTLRDRIDVLEASGGHDAR